MAIGKIGEILLNGAESSIDKGRDARALEVGIAGELLSKVKNMEASFYQDDGAVNYKGLKKSSEYKEFLSLANELKDFNPALLTGRGDRLAFWINLYNTIVVDGVVRLGIEKSVKEVRGFFKRIKYDIGGYHFSPDDIEHGIFRANSRAPHHPTRQFHPGDSRKRFSLKEVDARIHFALVCGSHSCPPIKFYSSEHIDSELDLAAANFINGADVLLSPEDMVLRLSMIFKWYEGDFGGKAGVVDFLLKYLDDGETRDNLQINKEDVTLEYNEYDWGINA